ncbi:MAG: hypothetical protein IPF54_26150 [Draconibacterium sp.]|nr:hypothetical protein [Draconibacterium sp.]
MLELWSRSKGDNLFGGMTIMIIVVIVLLAAFIILRFTKKQTGKRKRQAKNIKR